MIPRKGRRRASARLSSSYVELTSIRSFSTTSPNPASLSFSCFCRKVFFFDCFNEEFGPSPYALIFSLGSFSCSTVFYSMRFYSKIKEIFIYFFKIKAVAIYVQTDIWDAIGDVLFKENQMYKRGKGSFFLHLNWNNQY